jgi:hypothetical protein
VETAQQNIDLIQVPHFETRGQRQNWLAKQSPETRAQLTRQGRQRAAQARIAAQRVAKAQQPVAPQTTIPSVTQDSISSSPETVAIDPVEDAIKAQEALLQETDRIRRIAANASVGHGLAETALETELSESVILATIKKRYPELSGWREFRDHTRKQKLLRRTVMMEERLTHLICHSPIALFARFFSELQKLSVHEQETLRGVPQEELNRRLVELRSVIEKPARFTGTIPLSPTLELQDAKGQTHSPGYVEPKAEPPKVESVEPNTKVEVGSSDFAGPDLQAEERPIDLLEPIKAPVPIRPPATWTPQSTDTKNLNGPDSADELKRLQQRERWRR